MAEIEKELRDPYSWTMEHSRTFRAIALDLPENTTMYFSLNNTMPGQLKCAKEVLKSWGVSSKEVINHLIEPNSPDGKVLQVAGTDNIKKLRTLIPHVFPNIS